jgi:hypothetical protein
MLVGASQIATMLTGKLIKKFLIIFFSKVLGELLFMGLIFKGTFFVRNEWPLKFYVQYVLLK